MTDRSFWPPAEAAQSDYETLRGSVLTDGGLPAGPAASRFSRRGLAGLIAWPVAEPVYLADLVAATRPAWHPHVDPRVEALASGYQFLLAAADGLDDATLAAIGGVR